jgi:hypothetical protein
MIAAPVKKHRFIKYYHLAREEGLTPKTIKSGWRASGIYPWNPQKGLRSSQVKTKAITNPPSPPSPNHDDIDVLATPKSHHDVYHMIQSLDNGHMTQRETQAILRKAGKRIGQLAAQNAVSESKIRSLEAQLEELRGPKTRKRVVVDPNTKFANIDAIKKAMDEATEQEARIKAREPEKEAKKTADELAKAKMQDFMFEWQAI